MARRQSTDSKIGILTDALIQHLPANTGLGSYYIARDVLNVARRTKCPPNTQRYLMNHALRNTPLQAVFVYDSEAKRYTERIAIKFGSETIIELGRAPREKTDA